MEGKIVLPIVLFLIYTLIMFTLSFAGLKKTKSILSLTTGDGSMGIGVVALSLAASFTSAATLISMPGYVYQAGFSGIAYFNIFQTGGLLVGLLVVGRKVRNDNGPIKAKSIPEWLRLKYKSKLIGITFSLISIAQITFMVLIVILIGNVLNTFLGLTYTTSVIIVASYVFLYSIMGGSYTHGWTGMVQAIIMIIVVIWLILKSVPTSIQFTSFSKLIISQEPYYFSLVNPNGIIFKDYFEVVYAAFLMGFCNVFQPHIFNKALYLNKEKSWAKTSILGIIVISIFNLVLFLGIFIRVYYPNMTNYDTLFLNYVTQTVGNISYALIFLMLIAAAMSTLNGVIIGTISNISTELFPKEWTDKKALFVVRMVMMVLCLIVILFAINPPDFFLLIGMWGYNILMSAAFVPMICSIWFSKVSVKSVMASTITTIVVFVILMGSGYTLNGAWACGWAIPAGALVALIYELSFNRKNQTKDTQY